jgi:DNA mismatch repair protein MSH6
LKSLNYSSSKKNNHTGTIIPQAGVNPDYDASLQTIARIEKALDKELRRAQVDLGTTKLSYYHPNNSNEKYQLQVPANKIKDVPDDWIVKSGTKVFSVLGSVGFSCDSFVISQMVTRYWSLEIERMQKPLAEAVETKNQVRICDVILV